MVRITGEDARHIARVLRMKIGETLTVCDGAGTDLLCTVTALEDGAVCCHVDERVPSCGEPDVDITLYMALPKGDKMDFIVQKATELGVCTIVPYIASRSVSRPNSQTLTKKVERWNKIAREAAQQSGRGRLTRVSECMSFEQAICAAADAQLPLFFYELERQTHVQAVLEGKKFSSASVFIGPEGGFSDDEAQAAVSHRLHRVSMGPRILRCETAPIVALTTVLYASGNL